LEQQDDWAMLVAAGVDPNAILADIERPLNAPCQNASAVAGH
jgi:hypothetical protein